APSHNCSTPQGFRFSRKYGLARIIHELCVGSRRDSASHGFSATDPHTACICEGDERRVKSKNKRGDAEFMNHPG
ncbi:MAG: hypothetical protein OXR73_16245, partial [Myxococcales bacterium]|nr:hypothetical protein [Myxococcales bacterium]